VTLREFLEQHGLDPAELLDTQVGGSSSVVPAWSISGHIEADLAGAAGRLHIEAERWMP
jgi:hypothetical protein